MKPDQSKAEFLKRLGLGGEQLQEVNVAAGLRAMFAFYADQRADGCPIEEDGDMLLYQWGVYDSEDEAETFRLDITRQFIVPDEDEPYQLSLTFHFEPSAELREIESGNDWCGTPDGLADFRASVEASAAYRAVAGLKPQDVRLGFGAC